MLINKVYKFRIYPNEKQNKIILNTLGCTRYIYNYYLNKQIDLYEKSKKILTIKECLEDFKNLTNEKPFLKDVDLSPLRAAIFNMIDNFKKNLNKANKYPKFRRKYDNCTYKTDFFKSNLYGDNIKLDLINKSITLPKLKEIPIKGYKNLYNLDAKIISVIIIKETTDKLYASVIVEENINNEKKFPSTIVGIDLGIKDLVITSDLKKYTNLKFLNKYEKKNSKKKKKII